MMVSTRSQSNPAHCQFLYSSLVEWFFKVWKYYILNGWGKKECFMTHKKYMRFKFQVHKYSFTRTQPPLFIFICLWSFIICSNSMPWFSPLIVVQWLRSLLRFFFFLCRTKTEFFPNRKNCPQPLLWNILRL